MPEVTLIRRWGSHDAGQTVDVTEEEGRFLLGNHYASEDGSDDAARAGSRAPGTDGADLRAGGDISRGGGMQVIRGGRDGNRAGRVDGAPRADGSSPVYLTPAQVEGIEAGRKAAEAQRAERKAAESNEEAGEGKAPTRTPAQAKGAERSEKAQTVPSSGEAPKAEKSSTRSGK